jgi:cytochrome c-type biogenesis protein CcmH
VRERLRAGSSDGDVRDFLVRRYGEFVLLRPSFNWGTALLWIGPAALLVMGAAYTVLARRRRRGQADQTPPLTAAEKARLSALLKS